MNISKNKSTKKDEVFTMTKMTYAVAIDNAINGNITEEVRERLEALKESLAKRKSGSKTPTKTQKENETIKAVIAEVLTESGTKMTVTDLVSDERLPYTNQKVSALLRQMVEAKTVAKTMEGKKAYFSIV